MTAPGDTGNISWMGQERLSVPWSSPTVVVIYAMGSGSGPRTTEIAVVWINFEVLEYREDKAMLSVLHNTLCMCDTVTV